MTGILDPAKPRRLLRFTNAAKRTEPDVVRHMRDIFFPDRDVESDAPLVDVDEDDVYVAWEEARLGLIVRSREPRWHQDVLGGQPVYDVVHMVHPIRPLDLCLIGFDWRSQQRAFPNGYDLWVFRKGNQRHVRRGTQVRRLVRRRDENP